MKIEIFDPTMDLIERRTALKLAHDIPDMRAYAAAWGQLADEFQAIGFEANEALCRSEYEYYSKHPAGAYVREVDRSFATLTQVSA
jgi:hypothetical protein